MATAAPSMGAPAGAPNFKLNGVTLLPDEAEAFLEQAHALACCLDEAADPDLRVNRQILQSAARGIATLIHYAALAVEQREQLRARGRWSH